MHGLYYQRIMHTISQPSISYALALIFMFIISFISVICFCFCLCRFCFSIICCGIHVPCLQFRINKHILNILMRFSSSFTRSLSIFHDIFLYFKGSFSIHPTSIILDFQCILLPHTHTHIHVIPQKST